MSRRKFAGTRERQFRAYSACCMLSAMLRACDSDEHIHQHAAAMRATVPNLGAVAGVGTPHSIDVH